MTLLVTYSEIFSYFSVKEKNENEKYMPVLKCMTGQKGMILQP